MVLTLSLLKEEMATHSSILALRIPWTEETGGLQSMGHKELDMTEQLYHTHTHTHTQSFYMARPVFISGPHVVFLNLFIFNWRIVVLQHCVGFCHIST